MESRGERWRFTFLFLFSLFSSLCLFHLHLRSNGLNVNFVDITVKKNPKLPLRFRSDGTFKILQVADMHYGNGKLTRCKDVFPWEFEYCSDLNTTHFVRRLIEAEKPDFLAFTGDNIFGASTSDAAESLFGAFGPAIESGLPWAAILGNHDQESTMTREELMSLISLMDYSVSQVNPVVENPSLYEEKFPMENIDGFGNYNLTVLGAYGSHLANSSVFDLIFLDSGDRETVNGRRTYGWIRESQLCWLSSFSQAVEGETWGHEQSRDFDSSIKTTPALVFFHIPIPEIRQLYFQKIIGQLQEVVACSSVNSGVLQTLVSMKNVKAAFTGHDHVNDFCGDLSGVWFCYGGGSGYHGYGRKGWSRRARVILAELSKGEEAWLGVEKISTWKRLDDEALIKIDEQVLWKRHS